MPVENGGALVHPAVAQEGPRRPRLALPRPAGQQLVQQDTLHLRGCRSMKGAAPP